MLSGKPLVGDEGVARIVSAAIGSPACPAPLDAMRDASHAQADDEISLTEKTVPLGSEDQTPPIAVDAEKTLHIKQSPAAMPPATRSTPWLLTASLVVALRAGAYLALFQRATPQTSAPQASVAQPPAVAASVSAPMPPPNQDAADRVTTATGPTAAPDKPLPRASQTAGASVGETKLAKPMPMAKLAAAQKPQASLAKSGASLRCADFLQRFQLGEALSPEDLAVFQKECKK